MVMHFILTPRSISVSLFLCEISGRSRAVTALFSGKRPLAELERSGQIKIVGEIGFALRFFMHYSPVLSLPSLTHVVEIEHQKGSSSVFASSFRSSPEEYLQFRRHKMEETRPFAERVKEVTLAFYLYALFSHPSSV